MSGQLRETAVYFVQALRAAGLPLGPSATLDALDVLAAVGLERRDDVQSALRAVLVTRHDQTELFDQAFHVFWRNPKYLQRLMQMMMPEIATDGSERQGPDEKLRRRLFDALQNERTNDDGGPDDRDAPPEVEIDARFTFADSEVLAHKDFDQMTAAELQEARALLRKLRLPVPPMKMRRFETARLGDVDPRASFRASLRGGRDDGS